VRVEGVGHPCTWVHQNTLIGVVSDGWGPHLQATVGWVSPLYRMGAPSQGCSKDAISNKITKCYETLI
jgi:hypothetical protein